MKISKTNSAASKQRIQKIALSASIVLFSVAAIFAILQEEDLMFSSKASTNLMIGFDTKIARNMVQVCMNMNDFLHDCYWISLDNTTGPQYYKDHIGGRAVSSIQIGEDVIVTICKDQDCMHYDPAKGDGWSRRVEMVGPYIASSMAKFMNDQIDTLYIREKGKEKYVTMFAEQNYQFGQVGIFPEGEYNNDRAKENGLNLEQDFGRIQSMRVPFGYCVRFYDSDILTSASLIGTVCENTPKIQDVQGIQDEKRIKSFEVIKQKDLQAVGQWHRENSANFNQSFTVVEGLRIVDYSSEQSTTRTEFSQQIKNGFSFMGFSSEITLSFNEFNELVRTTQKTIDKSQEITRTFPCNIDEAYGKSVALYQWSVSLELDGNQLAEAKLGDYICRHGDGYVPPPKCPLFRCADSECETCTDGPKSVLEEQYAITIPQ